ncbi:MAG: hypothetical protein KDK96_00045 [Chlamydiia bacterium]|nr:hypothetical protein [Chlamydiia bacterium]
MINPLRLAEQYIHNVEPESRTEMIFCLIPVVNNVFLEVKRFQLQDSEKPQLKLIAATVSGYLWCQVIWAPALAKLQGYLSFKSRTMVFIGLTTYYCLSEKHIEWIRYKL